MVPESTVAHERMPRCKTAKDQISVLACADEEGSEQVPLMFFGASWEPRGVKKKTDFTLV